MPSPLLLTTYYRRIYFEALDLVINGIKNRFDQPGYKVYSNIEELLKATKKSDYDEEFKFVINFYKDDFVTEELKTQLDVMASNFPTDCEVNLQSIIVYLRGLSGIQKGLISQVCKLLSLLLVMPATNAVSERSFSCLRRTKTYLRATMTQSRLNNVMVLHVHKNYTDELCMTNIGNEFVRSSSHRELQFGKFLPSD